MSHEKYDVIIGGAGPAGLSAARELDKYGIAYVILECEKLGTTDKTWSVFEGQLSSFFEYDDYQDIIANKIQKTIMRTYDGTEIIFSEQNNHVLEQINETKLLTCLSTNLNGKIVDLAKIIHAEYENNQIKITYEHQEKQKHALADLYIDACGFNINNKGSLIVQKNNLQQNARTWRCLVYEMNGEINPNEAVIGEATIKDETKPFFWYIPYSDQKYVVGVMYLQIEDINENKARQTLENYIQLINLTGQKTKELFGAVPLGFFQKSSGYRFLLAGDSARHADPYTGYGLVKSITCGKTAGNYAAQAVMLQNFTEKFLSDYSKFIKTKYELNSRLQTIIEKIIFKSDLDDFCHFMKIANKLPTDIIKRTLRAELKPKDFLTILKELGIGYPPWKLAKLVGLKDLTSIITQACHIGKICLKTKT